jgi:hypothetical protein
VTITNAGNVILSNVQITSTVPLSYNTTAVADSLSLGEVVVLESNITYNNTMIRAPNMVLWTNITTTSAAANKTTSAQITVMPNRCTVNTTGACLQLMLL